MSVLSLLLNLVDSTEHLDKPRKYLVYSKKVLSIINLLAAGKFHYESTSYKIQNLYIKSLDISGRVPDLTAGRYIDQPRS